MLIFSMLFLLLSNAVTLRRDKSIVFTRTSIIILLYSSLFVSNSCFLFSMNGGIALYSGLFHISNIIQVFHLFIFLISALILQITSFYPLRVWLKDYSSILKMVKYDVSLNRNFILNNNKEQFSIIEYPLIMLFIITGSAFLISTSDLVSIFLSIELQSYGLYLLSTLYRNSESATSAGLTYFLLGGLSSCFIVLGTSLLYSNSGLTNLDGLYVINSLNEIIHNSSVPLYYDGDYINTALLILSVGFLFKVSAAPFHFWSPDVYDAVPTVVTTFIAIVAKISILVFLLELVYYTNTSLFTSGFSWTNTLLISSLLSLIVGTVVGLTQFRIKRLFAYSTISHLGFILLALTVNSIESTQAFIFYLMQYSLSNLNIFLLLLSMGYLLYNYVNNRRENLSFIDEKNSPIQFISQIKGFFYINPILSISFAITVFSFVGIPPLIGFFAKQMVLSAALDKGYVFITLLAILTSVISAVYYLNIIRQIFFDKPNYLINPLLINVDTYVRIIEKNNLISRFAILSKTGIFSSKEKITSSNIILSSYLTITISVITITILLFIFIPQEWLSMANILALTLNNP